MQGDLTTVQQAVEAGSRWRRCEQQGLSPGHLAAADQHVAEGQLRGGHPRRRHQRSAPTSSSRTTRRTGVWEIAGVGAGRPHPYAARLDPARPVHQPAAHHAAPLRADAGAGAAARPWWPGCAAASRVDVAAEAPPLRVGSDEIGQVGQAIDTVRQTAIRSAVDEARVRQGVNDMFRNLAGATSRCCSASSPCSTSMERQATDPDVLEDLFKMDHLTTRMRRHAEGLIILSGAPPGRSWSAPVKLIDVMRGAVAEVEDYARVTVSTQSRAALSGLRGHRRDPPAGRADRERDHALPAVHAGPGRPARRSPTGSRSRSRTAGSG